MPDTKQITTVAEPRHRYSNSRRQKKRRGVAAGWGGSGWGMLSF